MSRGKRGLNIKEVAVFGMLGAVMYASKILMDVFVDGLLLSLKLLLKEMVLK